MSEKFAYRSCFQPYIDALIREKRLAGYKYESEEYTLYSFDRFCSENNVSEPVITNDIMTGWGKQLPTEGKVRQAARISIIRQLSLYMQAYGIESYVPHNFSHNSHPAAYVLSEAEIRSFFEKLDDYYPAHNNILFQRLSLEYKVLFRMILCCGLRVSEARKLARADVDLDQGILRIRQSKGNNSRIVFMPDDLKELCQKYMTHLTECFGVDSEWFFPARETDRVLQVSSIGKQFQQFWNLTPYAGDYSSHPTVHSLRHTYVVRRMNQWMKDDISLESMMPYLSRYLGHASVEDTFYYYHLSDSAYEIIRDKSISSDSVIPEAEDYHEE